MVLSVFITTIQVLWSILGVFIVMMTPLIILIRNHPMVSKQHQEEWSNNKVIFARFSIGVLHLLFVYVLFGILDFDALSLRLVQNFNVSILSMIAGLLFLFVFYFCVKNGYSIEKLPRIHNSYLKMVALGLIRTTSIFLGLLFLFIPIFYHI